MSKLFWLFAGAMASGKTYSEHLKASQNLARGERGRERKRERQEGGRVIPIAGKHSDWFCFAVRGGTMPSQDAGLGALFRGGALASPVALKERKTKTESTLKSNKKRKERQRKRGLD